MYIILDFYHIGYHILYHSETIDAIRPHLFRWFCDMHKFLISFFDGFTKQVKIKGVWTKILQKTFHPLDFAETFHIFHRIFNAPLMFFSEYPKFFLANPRSECFSKWLWKFYEFSVVWFLKKQGKNLTKSLLFFCSMGQRNALSSFCLGFGALFVG